MYKHRHEWHSSYRNLSVGLYVSVIIYCVTHRSVSGWLKEEKLTAMYFIFVFITGAFLPLVLSCSVVPGTVFYSPTQRTVLAPIIFQGRVINTTTSQSSDYPTGQIFDACVRLQKIFKSPFEIPPDVCFGKFGIEELCLTYVFEGSDYVFFLNEDFTARYDGFPVAAYPVTDELVAAVQSGYCRASVDENCGKIKSLSLFLCAIYFSNIHKISHLQN